MMDSMKKFDASSFRQLITELPKTEIHLHLEGLASVDTIWQLMQHHAISVQNISSKEDLQRKFQVRSLDEFVDLFINVIQNCFKREDDVDFLILDARNYLKKNGIEYAEIFFAPSKFLLNGLSFQSLVEKLDAGVHRIFKTDGIKIRFLIDVSRSYGVKNAQKNMDLVTAHRAKSIIGIGLGGAESQGAAREFTDIFEKAITNDFYVVAHAGEDVGPESIWDTINFLRVSRIGHGISAKEDDKLMDFLAEKQIPLEICPTSNIFTRKYVTGLEDHPIRLFFDKGIFVTVNTDDPTIFGIDLIDEYMNLYSANIFSAQEIVTLIKNNIKATFLDETDKTKILNRIDSILNKHSFTHQA